MKRNVTQDYCSLKGKFKAVKFEIKIAFFQYKMDSILTDKVRMVLEPAPQNNSIGPLTQFDLVISGLNLQTSNLMVQVRMIA